MAFYKLHTLGQAGSGKPVVAIVSHTNGETVSGLITIAAGAQDDSRVAYVSLLIDGTEYEPTLTRGDVSWPVNTGHFSNGVHTIQARVVDNAGNPSIGGAASSAVGGNQTLSAAVLLNFTNVVQWIEPVSGFDTFVPISIRSAIFPTNWTVYVENESGSVIRTFTGFTSDGVVETEWDGKDNNAISAPAGRPYRVLFVLGELPPPEPAPEPGPGPSSSSLQTSQSAAQFVSSINLAVRFTKSQPRCRPFRRFTSMKRFKRKSKKESARHYRRWSKGCSVKMRRTRNPKREKCLARSICLFEIATVRLAKPSGCCP